MGASGLPWPCHGCSSATGFCGTADDEWLAEALVFCPIMADALI